MPGIARSMAKKKQMARAEQEKAYAEAMLRSCSKVTDPKGFGLSSYAVPLSRV